ncbi:MAG: hypothetical protein K2X01_03185 [Cyanobacteria bacterium]|nr:hypothetical protein [Cyanobacteriota bacterium]
MLSRPQPFNRTSLTGISMVVLACSLFAFNHTTVVDAAVRHRSTTASRSFKKVEPIRTKTPSAPATKTAAESKVANSAKLVEYTATNSLDLVKSPKDFMSKPVRFEATFNSFSNLGLDYKKALRDSRDYVSFLVDRPDISYHSIPLAELKLIYPRSKSEAVINLEAGDKIQVLGKVFSSALNEPWMDVEEIQIIKKLKPKDAKKEDAHCC